jgi:hypothetical protein
MILMRVGGVPHSPVDRRANPGASDARYRSAGFGDTTDPVVLAERLDGGLEVLDRYCSGQSVDHEGKR